MVRHTWRKVPICGECGRLADSNRSSTITYMRNLVNFSIWFVRNIGAHLEHTCTKADLDTTESLGPSVYRGFSDSCSADLHPIQIDRRQETMPCFSLTAPQREREGERERERERENTLTSVPTVYASLHGTQLLWK
jgi:hypothetical protein